MAMDCSRVARKLTRILFLVLMVQALRADASENPDSSPLPQESNRISSWSDTIGNPQEFEYSADGSRRRGGGTIDPRSLPDASVRVRRAPFALRPPRPGVRPERLPIPISSSWSASRRDEETAGPKLLGPELGLAAGLVCLLAAAWMWPSRPGEEELPGQSQPRQDPAPAVFRLERREFLPPEKPSPRIESPASPVTSPEPAGDLAPDFTIRHTWRAISLREQQLIDRWNCSPEKAAGRASLEEWLDARGKTQGVDITQLKEKLRRDV